MCGNTNKDFLAIRNGKVYCRRCVTYQRGKKAEDREYEDVDIKLKLKYPLTSVQQNASNKILEYVSNNESVIVNAVCGAGKTELVYAAMIHFLSKGKKVAFAIPRKDVVVEIYQRLKRDFPFIKICEVYGGHHDDIEGQLIVLTTHQLYRYNHYFDLLILDEADAFPFYGNPLLNKFLMDAIKGPIIYLSATIKDNYKQQCSNIVYVNKRFHNHKLPEPMYIKTNIFNKMYILNSKIAEFKKNNKQVLIFVPTIHDGIFLKDKLSLPFVYSSYEKREETILDFKQGKIAVLITTSILERGITIKGVQVIVYEADNEMFDCSSLVQIAGRVGRNINEPEGDVYFLASSLSLEMRKCIEEIKKKNADDE